MFRVTFDPGIPKPLKLPIRFPDAVNVYVQRQCE
jgi:hypothetical protein